MDDSEDIRRRQFIAVGAGLGVATALSGCLGSGSEEPPPRKSSVISNFTLSNGMLTIELADDMWVVSRYDGTQQSVDGTQQSVGGTQQSLAGLNPIGVASAKGSSGGGGGRGATGRGTGGYASAPRTGHGYAWYHGGDYTDEWYENHRDEVTKYGIGVATLGLAYLGTTSQMEDDTPGAGPVPWDKEKPNPPDTVTYDGASFPRNGWYRIGANIVGTKNNHDFRWECYDLKIASEGSGTFAIEEEWKVSPRI